MKKRLVCIGLALALLAGLSLTAAAEDLELPAPSCILMEKQTGQVLRLRARPKTPRLKSLLRKAAMQQKASPTRLVSSLPCLAATLSTASRT